MANLDSLEELRENDPMDMLSRIEEWPEHFRNGFGKASKIKLPIIFRRARNITFLGMGGSAIGGELLVDLLANHSKIPISVWRDYDVPNYIDHDSLVFVCSYSGETEETLSGFRESLQRGAKIITISSGGTLGREAHKRKILSYQFKYSAQPRAALGYLYGGVLGLMSTLGFLPWDQKTVDASAMALKNWQRKLTPRNPITNNPAKQFVQEIEGKIPVVLGAGIMKAVARRWKAQFNENVKSLAFAESLPEADHNLISGSAVPETLKQSILILFLASQYDHERNKLRIKLTADLFSQNKLATKIINLEAKSPLSEQLQMIMLGDYISFYLASLYDQDPTAIPTIQSLKKALK